MHDPVDDRLHVEPSQPRPSSSRPRSPAPGLLTPAPSLNKIVAAESAPSNAPVLERPRHSSARFHFWYIDSASQRVPSLSSATIRLDPEEFVNLRKIEFRAYQKDHAFVKQLRMVDDSPRNRDVTGLPTYFAFIAEDAAPPTCSKFDHDADEEAKGTTSRGGSALEQPATAPSAAVNKKAKPTQDRTASHKRGLADEPIFLDSDSDDEDFVALGSHGITGSKIWRKPHNETETHKSPVIHMLDSPTSVRSFDRFPLDTPSPPRPSARNATQAAQPGPRAGPSVSKPSRTHTGPRLSSHAPPPNPFLDPAEPVEAAALPDFDPASAIIFPAGSYEVVLILDSREVESKTNRDKISDALAAKGVKVETRSLRLGDICWIARRLDGLGGEEDECVLDYVVERKRLDDLCTSIRDGRYTEQCVSASRAGMLAAELTNSSG